MTDEGSESATPPPMKAPIAAPQPAPLAMKAICGVRTHGLTERVAGDAADGCPDEDRGHDAVLIPIGSCRWGRQGRHRVVRARDAEPFERADHQSRAPIEDGTPLVISAAFPGPPRQKLSQRKNPSGKMVPNSNGATTAPPGLSLVLLPVYEVQLIE